MLNVSSIEFDDRTARARIRDAALQRFAADGFSATTVRAVAADARVSPGLVLHHFGSKDGLRDACDAHLLQLVEQKFATTDLDQAGLGSMERLLDEGLPAIRYLARSVAEGAPTADRLVDDLVGLARTQLDRWVEAGVVRPSRDPQMRATVLVVWDLAVLVLAGHVQRTTGSDPFSPDGLARWAASVLELLTTGLFTSTIDPTTLERPRP
jgi:TetR/AcrR family transcriptional regulator, regulator of cefoperazone and chloramphenicol sensitivity